MTGYLIGRVGAVLRALSMVNEEVNPGLVVEGSWGMAAAVFGRSGEPDWAPTSPASSRASAPIGGQSWARSC